MHKSSFAVASNNKGNANNARFTAGHSVYKQLLSKESQNFKIILIKDFYIKILLETDMISLYEIDILLKIILVNKILIELPSHQKCI